MLSKSAGFVCVQKHSRSNKTSVRVADKCLIDPVKEGFDPVFSLFNGLHSNFHKERNQRIGGKEVKSSVAHSGAKTSRAKCTNDADSSSCQPFEAHRANDFVKFQRSEGQSKSGLPDGLFRISRPYTASRTGQSVCLPRTTKTESIDGLLLSPRLHSSRRTESQCIPASSTGGGLFVRGEPAISQPQRSLESPKPPPSAASADAELAALATGSKAVNFKKSVMEASWTSADVDPRFGTSGRGNCHASSYFHRQDSFPTARSSSRLNSWQTSGQYQDVSQITAVQVTPRPKPRAFPRTNPSYVATQRRDGALGGSYRKVSESNQLLMSPADVSRQAFYNPGKDHASNVYGGAQTLHASHLHYKDPILAGEAKRSVCKNEDYDSDTSQSSTSSELNDLLHQYTLDSRVLRPHAHQFASSLHCPSAGASQSQTTVFSAGTLAADYEVASAMSGDLSPVGLSSFQKSRTGGSYPIQADGHREQPKKPAVSSKEPVLMRHCRRNSEPDYVNISSRREQRGTDASQTLKSHGKQKTSASPGLEDDEGSRNGGTLRVQDHSSPSRSFLRQLMTYM